MKNIIIYQLICIFSLLISCASSNTIDDNGILAIKVDAFSEGNDMLKLDSMLVKVDTAMLIIPDTIISYSVEDACVIDDYIYILDQSNNIIVFDLTTKKCVNIINAVGKGHGECTKPIAITSDHNNIYILDMMGLVILSYNKNMEFKEKVKIGYPCIDFEKTESGFLLYNLNSNNEVGRIIVTDNMGKKVDDFLKIPACTKKSLPTKHLFQKYNNVVCILDPYTSDLFLYEDNTFKQIASLISCKDEDDTVNPVSAFFVKNKIISQYWSKFVMTSIFDKVSGTYKSGLADINNSQYGFMPIIQRNEVLYGIYPDMNEGVAYHIFQYHFK